MEGSELKHFKPFIFLFSLIFIIDGYASTPPSEPTITATTSTTEPSAQGATTYTLDPDHTYVLWRVSHFGFSSPSGKWHAKGTLVLDERKPEGGKLDVTIDIASLETGLTKFNDHLISDEFLHASKFPTAKFVSDQITITGKNTAKVQGKLTLHGVTKPVILDVTLNKVDISPVSNKKTAGFTATGEFNRSDFGIKAFLPGVGDKVNLLIEAEAVKK